MPSFGVSTDTAIWLLEPQKQQATCDESRRSTPPFLSNQCGFCLQRNDKEVHNQNTELASSTNLENAQKTQFVPQRHSQDHERDLKNLTKNVLIDVSSIKSIL